MPRNEELTADYQFERLRFENPTGDVVIATAIVQDGGAVAIKGPEPDDGFVAGRTYRFFGYWTKYTNRHTGRSEEQFSFSTVVETTPMTKSGALVYLQRVKGIGKRGAEELWAEYGENVFEAIKYSDLSECSVLTGVATETLELARELFLTFEKSEKSTIELLGILAGRGFPKSTIDECIKRWGVTAARRIRKNPFILMALPGVGFTRCDQLYLSMRLPAAAMKRQAYCATFGVDREASNSGSTWVEDKFARAAVKGMIGGTEARPEKAIKLALRGELMASTYAGEDGRPDWDGDVRYLSDRKRARNERRLAELITKAVAETPSFDSQVFNLDVSQHQLNQINYLTAAEGCIRILGGGPGTGKTYTLARLVAIWMDIVGPREIALAAPTGKAAVRITESMAAAGIRLRAKTWHSLLEYGPGGFARDEHNPLPYRIVIGDEQSMQDTDMAYYAFRARAAGCLFFLVGDVNQLPPVGHGAPLRDMIQAGVPHAILTEVRRNSGEIAEQCRVMREESKINLSSQDGNLKFIEAMNPRSQIGRMLAVLEDHNNDASKCQVLVPTNKSGDLGRKSLNLILQNKLNSSRPISGSPFRQNDKVVCLKNGWLGAEDYAEEAITQKGQVYVANGEIGQIVECEPRRMLIELQDPWRVVRVFRNNTTKDDTPDDDDAVIKPEDQPDTGCKWDLAYALSVHKMQGSEAPIVIVMLDESGGARRVCSREWLYTAISRAKEQCYVIGKENLAHDMVRRSKINDRKTFLAEQIQVSEVLV
jgi:exodeoxyribonuclease V alpha subunit